MNRLRIIVKQEIVSQLNDATVLLHKLKRNLEHLQESYNTSNLDDLANQGLIEEIITNVNLSEELLSISKNYLL
jgi:succinylarginine dihydrolase